jgi:hypothetical protein
MVEIVRQSISDKFEQKRVIIFVSFLNLSVKMVRVSIYDSISVLFHFLPFGQKTVFYQGNNIQSHKTFENYGITDNDRIIIFPTNQMTLATEQFWKKQQSKLLKIKIKLMHLKVN